MKIPLGEFNAKLGKQDIFKLTTGNDSHISIVVIMMLE